MTTVVSRVYNELDKDPYYLRYYLNDAPESVVWARKMANMSKTKIMTNTKKAVTEMRKRAKQNIAKNTSMTEAQINNYLDGTYFKEIKTLSEKRLNDSVKQMPSLEEAEAILQQTEKNCDTLQQFANAIKAAFEEMYSDKNLRTVYHKYAAQIVNQCADSNNIGADNKSEIANMVIKNILTKENQQVFATTARDNDLYSSMLRVATIIKHLPDLKVTKGTSFEVLHGNEEAGSGKVVSTIDEILAELLQKVRNYFYYSNKISTEEALAFGLWHNHHQGLKMLYQEGCVEVTGKTNVDVKFKASKRLQQEYEMAGLNIKRLTTKVSKPDVMIYTRIDDKGNGVWVGNSGFTVKNYPGLSFINGDDGMVRIKGNLTLQSGGPLLGALAREINMSDQNRHHLVQYLVGKGSTDIYWEDIKNTIANKMFLSALVGLKNTGEETHFIVINGKIFTIRDFVNKFAESDKSAKISEYYRKAKDKTLGLLRETYQNMNKWVGDPSANIEDAQQRSRELEKQAYKMLGDTKIKISVNLTSMGALQQLNNIL